MYKQVLNILPIHLWKADLQAHPIRDYLPHDKVSFNIMEFQFPLNTIIVYGP
jgi:hypothetical protein